jgi:hypothetical protein
MPEHKTSIAAEPPKPLSRRKILKGGALVGGAAAAALAVAAVPSGVEAQGRGRRLTVMVNNAAFTSFPLDGDPPHYFIVVGDIVAVDGAAATGKYFCRGEIFLGDLPNTPDPDAVSFVDQRFRIDGVGALHGVGAEGDGLGEPLALIGGTGRYVGVSGSYTGTGNPTPFADGVLNFTFSIQRG